MGNFSFIEYSYNSTMVSQRAVFENLTSLGFSLRSKHTRNQITFWSQQYSIIMVRDNTDLPVAGKVTGFGLTADNNSIASCHDAVPCIATEFFKIDFPVMGFNIYLLQESTLESLSQNNSYEIVNENRYKTASCGLKQIVGIEFDSDNERLKSIIEHFGFTNDSDNRTRFVSPNKSFTLLFRHKGGNKAASIVIDTQDVFKSTASLTLNRVDFLKFETSLHIDFKDLTHKIVGYNCAVFGNYNNYSIENFIPATIEFDANIVIRQRKQLTKLDTETFDFYDNVNRTVETVSTIA
jgi:hypothetical protein